MTNIKGVTTQEIEGIQRVVKFKYLGMTIGNDRNEIIQEAKASIRRNITAIKWRLRQVDVDLKEIIMTAYVRSLLLYFATPLVTARLISAQSAEKIEREYLREVHLLPRDIKREAIVNVAQFLRPAGETVAKLAGKVRERIEYQTTLQYTRTIRESNPHSDLPPRREKIYIPRALADAMWAYARGSTCVHFNSEHFCVPHETRVDRDHLR